MTRKYIKNCTGDSCEIGQRASSGLASKIIFQVLFVCFVGVSVYMIFFSHHMRILNISVFGTQELDNQEVRQVVENSLQGKYVGLIPRNNFLFISQKKMESLLIGDFKKIRTVSVNKKFSDTVEINIYERKALLVWCAREKCFLLDEKGTAYSEADFSSPELVQNNLLQISDTSGREVTIGSNVITPAYEQYVLSIKDALTTLGFEANGQYYTPSRMAEEINVKTAPEVEFYFSTQYPLESALKTLTTLFKKEIPEDRKGDLVYIDLRNENKAFYKFKSIEPPVIENLEVTSGEVKKEEEKQ